MTTHLKVGFLFLSRQEMSVSAVSFRKFGTRFILR